MGSKPAMLTSTIVDDAVGAVGVDVVPGIAVEEDVTDAADCDAVDAVGVVAVDDVVVVAEAKDNKAVLISCNNKSRNTFSYPSNTAMSDHGWADVLRGPSVTINATEHTLSAEIELSVVEAAL